MFRIPPPSSSSPPPRIDHLYLSSLRSRHVQVRLKFSFETVIFLERSGINSIRMLQLMSRSYLAERMYSKTDIVRLSTIRRSICLFHFLRTAATHCCRWWRTWKRRAWNSPTTEGMYSSCASFYASIIVRKTICKRPFRPFVLHSRYSMRTVLFLSARCFLAMSFPSFFSFSLFGDQLDLFAINFCGQSRCCGPEKKKE